MQLAAIEIYVRKIYKTHEVQMFSRCDAAKDGFTSVHWTFKTMPPEALVSDRSRHAQRAARSAMRQCDDATMRRCDDTTTCVRDRRFIFVLSLPPHPHRRCRHRRVARLAPQPPGLASAHSESSVDLKTLREGRSRLDSLDDMESENDSSLMSDDARYPLGNIPSHVLRYGVFACFGGLDEAKTQLGAVLDKFPSASASKTVPRASTGPVNCLHVALLRIELDSDALTAAISATLREHLASLTDKGVRRVTFLVGHGADGASKLPGIYTFRAKTEFAEDILSRHIEPPHAFHLDLMRLTNFAIRLADTQQSQSGNVHIYEALPKKTAALAVGVRGKQQKHKRFFIRVVSITNGYLPSESERMFVESLNVLELKVGAEEQAAVAAGIASPTPSSNHIFLNVVSTDIVVEPAYVEKVIRTMMNRYWDKASRLGVAHFEVKMVCRFSRDSAPVPLRVLASNPSGFVLKVETYVEVKDEARGGAVVFRSIGQMNHGTWDGLSVTAPYSVVRPFERERSLALALSDTLYCYDFLEVRDQRSEVWLFGAFGGLEVWRGAFVNRRVVSRIAVGSFAARLVGRRSRAITSEIAVANGEHRSRCRRAVARAKASVEGLRPKDRTRAKGTSTSSHTVTSKLRDDATTEDRRPMTHDPRPTDNGRWTMDDDGARQLFERAVEMSWEAFAAAHQRTMPRPTKLMHAVELVVRRRGGGGGDDDNGGGGGADGGDGAPAWSFAERDELELAQVSRPPGKNDVGMVAWLVTLRTPEYPEGRQLVLIANDITVIAGSFGTREDLVFDLASKFARERGLPRLYLAANSGARIGLSARLRACYRVAWVNEAEPMAGVRYLYLTPTDYAELHAAGAVNAERLVDPATGDEHYRITDVIGSEADLGVENLAGSGLIAGETSRAYNDVFTLTLVVGRSVGIGACLVRRAREEKDKGGYKLARRDSDAQSSPDVAIHDLDISAIHDLDLDLDLDREARTSCGSASARSRRRHTRRSS